MAEVKWIKITVDMFDDEKIKIIQSMPDGDTLLIVWIKLITLAGKTNDGGYVYISEGMPYTDEMLSIIMNKPLNTIRLALDTFSKLGMIENDVKGIYLLNFEKHQSLDKLAEIREQTRRRVARHRENKKFLLNSNECNVTDTLRNDTDIDKEEDIELEKEIDININTPAKAEPKQTKKAYGEYGRVKLTENQYKKLCEDFNKDTIDNQIMLLDEYVESNNNKNKYSNFNLVLRKSIREGWFKKTENKMIQTKKEIVPEWMDKETEIEPMSPEAQKRMEELIKELQS